MIYEDYVSFEIAKLLKEKGFNEACHVFYDSGSMHILKFVQDGLYNNASVVVNNGTCVASTLQMAMKWLREVHHIAINIGWGEIFEDKYQWWSIVLNMDNDYMYETTYHASYEKACEVALKYTLENLI